MNNNYKKRMKLISFFLILFPDPPKPTPYLNLTVSLLRIHSFSNITWERILFAIQLLRIYSLSDIIVPDISPLQYIPVKLLQPMHGLPDRSHRTNGHDPLKPLLLPFLPSSGNPPLWATDIRT